MGNKVTDLGEVKLIERIERSLGCSSEVILGIGDDAAIIKHTKNKHLLFCSDMLIEDVHFSRKNASASQIGKKALAVNISDIAAMGGVPRFCVVSLGLPKNTTVNFIDKFYKGLNNLAKKFNVFIVGGDTNRSNKLIVDVALIGEVNKRNVVKRKGARDGDVVFVTGRLGGSASKKHLDFLPRIKESKLLVKNFRINSMIDISDGLAIDLCRILKASAVGALIYEELIPLSKGVKSVKNALYDGEDFELLFTMSAREADKLIKNKRKLFGVNISKIGYIRKERQVLCLIDKKGREEIIKKKGFSHF